MSEKPNIPEHAEGTSGLRDILALITEDRSPFQVGDLVFNEDDRIRLRGDAQPLCFAFAFRGVDFEARMVTSPEALITLSAELGKVPYSIEQGADRRGTQRIVEATADMPNGRIEISGSQDMSLVATAQPPSPLTPASIMAAITSLLLDFGPYIDLLRVSLLAATDYRGPASVTNPPPEPPPESSSAP